MGGGRITPPSLLVMQAFGAMVEIHAKLLAQVTSLTAFASVTCSSIPE